MSDGKVNNRSRSRYREARTLVRRLCRLPGEEPAVFKRKIARLRGHFEQFNVDVSELCQWMMGLRRTREKSNDPGDPGSFGVLGDFLLEPEIDDPAADEAQRDRRRREVFDAVAGFSASAETPVSGLPKTLIAAAQEVAGGPRTPTTERLFERLRALEPAHRLVLLKAAAEWVVARYQRGVENWSRQREEWEKERNEWERLYPELTPAIRDRFTTVFKNLKDPERDGATGLRRKNPRICPYQRIRGNLDNCIYAGEKGHGPLCWKFAEFVKVRKTKNPAFNDKKFIEDVQRYLLLRKQGIARDQALGQLFPRDARAQQRLLDNWTAYLNALGLKESTILDAQRLPHCFKIGDTYENSKCEWNPHTELCRQYKAALHNPVNGLDEATLELESLYREWRRDYLAGPRKPQFRYPSSRDLPMPKIFGAGFHEIDFDRSILRLRLDDMPEGEWIEFGFTAWPRGYRPSKRDVKVTSVHVNFVGTRARAGFRFDIPHQASRFTCTQDEIDELRSRRFPRQAQDQQFLDAARKRLLETFSGDAGRPLRVLAVDLGETGVCAAVYEGPKHVRDVPLAIVKINKLYEGRPDALEPDKHGRPEKRQYDKDDPRGLRKEHVGRHLERIASGTPKIAQIRVQASRPGTLRGRDFRGLKRHIAWMIRDWVRHNAAQVVATAEEHRCDLIVFESLRGFRAPGYDQMDDSKKRWLAMFAFGRIRRKVAEKAVERGMRVVTAPYFKSSQVCSACGHEQRNKGRWRNNKKQSKFACECGDPKAKGAGAAGCRCTVGLNSDANAARVLARVFWGEITLPAPGEKTVRRRLIKPADAVE